MKFMNWILARKIVLSAVTALTVSAIAQAPKPAAAAKAASSTHEAVVVPKAHGSERVVPTFQVDPSWPHVPAKWVLGPVSGLTVDSQDHIWVITRPRELVHPDPQGRPAAPPIMEFDMAGNFIKGWGGPGTGYEWPAIEHGITVDPKGFVWIAGRGRDDDQILKFTNDGKFVMQIGHSGMSRGNTDVENLNLPADVTVYPPTNEIFVADGYGNRRIIVFDGDTGKFKRMWGAFGNIPTDPDHWRMIKGSKSTVGYDPNVSPDDQESLGTIEAQQGPQQFANVHSVRISHDGTVYVCDRANMRVQAFTLGGKYLGQVFISRGNMGPSHATGTLFGKPRAEVETEVHKAGEAGSRITFSPDPEQKYMYVLDRRYQRILILDRKSFEMLGSFGGGPGTDPGQFYILHDMATDSHGNFYTAEINENSRVQKLEFKGMATEIVK